MNRLLAIGAHTLLILLLTFAATVAAAESAVPAQQRPGQNGLYKAAQMSKASTSLVRDFSEYRAHANQGGSTAFMPSDQFLSFAAGRVLIDARATASGAALLDDLNQLGLLNGAQYGERRCHEIEVTLYVWTEIAATHFGNIAFRDWPCEKRHRCRFDAAHNQ